MTEPSRTVLVIEDDLDTSTLVVRRLRRHGWQCLTAKSVGETLQLLREEGDRFDLLLLDYNLPDGNGAVVVEAAKSRLPPIPVIVATGMGDERLAADCLRQGATDYIIKGGQFWDLLPDAADRALRVTAAVTDASRLAAVVNATPEAIISLNVEGRIVTWNPAASRLYARPQDAVLGHLLTEFIPEGEIDRFYRQFARTLQGRHARRHSLRRRPDDTCIPVAAVMSPITNDTHDVIGVAVTERDLRPQNEAARLQRRTSELEQVNQELEQFAAIAAHDLQSPLRVATCSLDLLEMDTGEALNEQGHRYLDDARQALRRSKEMIESLLDYARQSAAHLDRDVLISAAVPCRIALDNLRTELDACGGELQLDDLPEVRFDPVQLGQVFQNIIGNALRYRSTDRPSCIRIAGGSDPESGETAITISDNGVGISADALESIFQLFHRGTAVDGHGCGIGLAVCKKLIEARGGSVTVDSVVGVGTTFTIRLPPHGVDADQSGAQNIPLMPP